MLEVEPIPAFHDNYFWLIRPSGDSRCCIVDPGDAGPVIDVLDKRGLELAAIFITHHHADHTGGIGRLLERNPVPVYGPTSPHIPAVTRPVAEGDEVHLFDQVFRVLEIPGHTLDHIAYFTRSGDHATSPLLFCGDTLFAGGCGRVFEGTHEMMHGSLQKLAHLPPETRVYCAHEYTMANLAFARAVTPTDPALLERINRDGRKREESLPTVPTTIAVELATNPFLRCADPALAASASRHSGETLEQPAKVFAAIRRWKDSY